MQFSSQVDISTFLKSCSRVSQKAKLDLKVTHFPPVDVVFIPDKNVNSFVSHVPENLRKLKWTEQLPNIPSMIQFLYEAETSTPF